MARRLRLLERQPHSRSAAQLLLENGARTQKLRVYEMRKNPAAREMLGYLFVRGGVHCRRTASKMDIFFETHQFSSIFSLVAGGFGVSIVPEMAASHAHGCRLIPMRRPSMRRIGYAYVRRPFVPSAERAFVAWLKSLEPIGGRMDRRHR